MTTNVVRRKENHLPALYQQLFLLMNKFPGDLPKFRLALTMIIAHQRLRDAPVPINEDLSVNSLFPILSMAGAGQVGAALALYWRAQPHSALRSQVRGAIIPGLLGVGEPLITILNRNYVPPESAKCPAR